MDWTAQKAFTGTNPEDTNGAKIIVVLGYLRSYQRNTPNPELDAQYDSNGVWESAEITFSPSSSYKYSEADIIQIIPANVWKKIFTNYQIKVKSKNYDNLIFIEETSGGYSVELTIQVNTKGWFSYEYLENGEFKSKKFHNFGEGI